MEQAKIAAFKLEFPRFANQFDKADSITVRRLDKAKLREKKISKKPRDYYFNPAAGDSYSQITIETPNFIEEHESILDSLIKYNNDNVDLVIEILEEGGFGLPNQNEFNYGETKNIIIWKKSKFDLPSFIKDEINKYRLEIQREADF